MFNATHIKLYIKAVIEKKSKAADQKKTNKARRGKEKFETRSFIYLFITMKVLRANATNINTHGAEKKKHVLSLLLIE